MATWSDIDAELAAFGEARIAAGPCYLGTVDGDGVPRVHPVTPFMADGRLWVFMEPTSPKGRDLRAGRAFALHTSVPDNAGTGGEFSVRGSGRAEEDPARRAEVAAACPYPPADRYVLFELEPREARSLDYGDDGSPTKRAWKVG